MYLIREVLKACRKKTRVKTIFALTAIAERHMQAACLSFCAAGGLETESRIAILNLVAAVVQRIPYGRFTQILFAMRQISTPFQCSSNENLARSVNR